MSSNALIRLLALIALLSLTALFGCSDSDTAAPNNDPTTEDTTGPLVLNISPENLENGVALNDDVVILFTEAVDQTTLAAALTLSSGDVSDITWNTAGTQALIAHTNWAQGVTVSVTVGTGLTDLAGNAMPQDFGSTFYTYSPDVVMVDTDFFAPLDAVPPTGYFVLQFSHEMDLTSILNAYTLTEDPVPGKALPGIRVGTVGGDYTRVKIIWDGALTPLHTYHFNLSTDARTRDGAYLTQGFTLDFTAGAVVDETPPYILDTTPALDAVVGTDLATITITFSEPIDPSYGTPDTRSAMLDLFMARDPVWNDEGDEMTVYLQGPLPEGIRFYAVWNVSQLRDMAGNFSTGMDSLSFMTSGQADLFPVREDMRIYYRYDDDKAFVEMLRQTFENIGTNNFERVMHRLTPAGYDEESERWFMRKEGLDLLFRGFQEDAENFMFNPAVNYLPDPVPATWSGTSTLTVDGHTVNLAFTGTYLYTERQYFDLDKGSSGAFLDNCVTVELYHSLTPVGAASPIDEGTDWLYICPGLGVMGMESEGAEFEDGVEIDSWYEEYFFQAMALDDRYESTF